MGDKNKISINCNSHDDISEIMLAMDDMKLFKRIRNVGNSGYNISATCNIVSLNEKYDVIDELSENYDSMISHIIIEDNGIFKHTYS